MHEDIEYRVALARAMRKAGASFELIADALKEEAKLAQRRQGGQSFTSNIQGRPIAHCRQNVAAGMRQQRARYEQIGTALNISYTGARNLVQRAERREAMPDWLNGLDMRTANVLLRAGFESVEDVRNAIATGKEIGRIKARRINMIEAWLQAAT